MMDSILLWLPAQQGEGAAGVLHNLATLRQAQDNAASGGYSSGEDPSLRSE